MDNFKSFFNFKETHFTNRRSNVNPGEMHQFAKGEFVTLTTDENNYYVVIQPQVPTKPTLAYVMHWTTSPLALNPQQFPHFYHSLYKKIGSYTNVDRTSLIKLHAGDPYEGKNFYALADQYMKVPLQVNK